ncbi:hypothetical protein [Mesorhizobium sp. M8A.F.Ca.ET.021.01.1.1]|uniref:hypothetical protein n=1 Tax=Mesorhizobium sp. M8A.F.Ca.ET.021.01.1.1 TaxID=2496757 RepID=UPI000FCAC62A|nr:hypothetical protein [Mesorhizobium sp. M8A.F.Ca.ET.021.01.1.1]RUW56709.1 hypothetical protein EOA36_02675 [Mesorhizobium sp. M8A.F.Ca.ET.021.01.1.1]
MKAILICAALVAALSSPASAKGVKGDQSDVLQDFGDCVMLLASDGKSTQEAVDGCLNQYGIRTHK